MPLGKLPLRNALLYQQGFDSVDDFIVDHNANLLIFSQLDNIYQNKIMLDKSMSSIIIIAEPVKPARSLLQDGQGFLRGGPVGGADHEGNGQFITALRRGNDVHTVGAEGRINAAGGPRNIPHAIAAHGEQADILDDIGRIVNGHLSVPVQARKGIQGRLEIGLRYRNRNAELGRRLGNETDVHPAARQGAEDGRGYTDLAHQAGTAHIDQGKALLNDIAGHHMPGFRLFSRYDRLA